MLHIGIVEHRTMNNTSVRRHSTSSATDLFLTNQNIIMAGTSCVNAHLVQDEQQHIDKTIEGEAHLLLFSNKRQHQIVAVSIDTASPTLPLIYLNTMFMTIVEIDLIIYHLITPIDNTGVHLPKEESVVS